MARGVNEGKLAVFIDSAGQTKVEQASVLLDSLRWAVRGRRRREAEAGVASVSKMESAEEFFWWTSLAEKKS